MAIKNSIGQGKNSGATRMMKLSFLCIIMLILSLPALSEMGTSNLPRQQTVYHRWNVVQAQTSGIQPLGTIYLDNGIVRVGINLDWGGGISEIVYKGKNIVNNDDPGRLIQISFYDGGDYYNNLDTSDPNWGWNPVQGGDKYGHGSGVISFTQSASKIYTKCQPCEWNPDNKGGGPSLLVRSDCYFEQWVSLDKKKPEVIKVTYKLTHLGTDEHLLAGQEFPCVYVNSEFDRMIIYRGLSPWTNSAVTEESVPIFPNTGNWYSPEYWAALVNSENLGLAVYTPWQNCYPGCVGTLMPGGGTNYFRPTILYSIGERAVVCATIYLVVGDYTKSREGIYALHRKEHPKTEWGFNSKFNWAEGWNSWNQLTSLKVSGGKLATSSTGGDPYMGYQFDLSIPAESYPKIEMKMKTSAGVGGCVYFITVTDTKWDENKVIRFSLKPGNKFRKYVLNMNNSPTWTGTIKKIRLDPTNTASDIEIDYLRFMQSRRRPNG